MTRTEFLNELEQNLNQSLDQNQIYAVLHSFADIYNHGERQGKREFEISNEIGKPKELANQIIAMWACDTLKKSPNLKNLFSAFGSLYRMSIWGPVLGFPALLFSLLPASSPPSSPFPMWTACWPCASSLSASFS